MVHIDKRVDLLLAIQFLVLFLLLGTAGNVFADDQTFIQHDEAYFAISPVQVIDGTGQLTQNNQTVLVKDGVFVEVGDVDKVNIPRGAVQIDGTGKTIIPGFVMMHEHMFYPSMGADYTEMLRSFPLLYLAGGATTVRTAGTMNAYGDLNLNKEIVAGNIMGPDIDVTAPYLTGPGLPILKMNRIETLEDADRMMAYWQAEGVTSYKAYTTITRAQLGRVIQKAHQKNHKVTGHLCSVTYREAANLGIDNLEHGFAVMTDFVKDKKPDECPESSATAQSLASLDVTSDKTQDLIALLVKNNVAITSTLTIFEQFVTGTPKTPDVALNVLIPELKAQYEQTWQALSQQEDNLWNKVYAKTKVLEKMFVEAGGTLLVGTDPTGYGGVIAGFANQRAVELIIDMGFSVEEAIAFSTLNGARFLKRENTVGSVEQGKRADFILLNGNLKKDTDSINKISAVFKNGVGYNSEKIRASLKHTVGLH